MAAYNYKVVRDLLIQEGVLDEYGEPVDKEKYGHHLDISIDGNIWSILADYIENKLTTN